MGLINLITKNWFDTNKYSLYCIFSNPSFYIVTLIRMLFLYCVNTNTIWILSSGIMLIDAGVRIWNLSEQMKKCGARRIFENYTRTGKFPRRFCISMHWRVVLMKMQISYILYFNILFLGDEVKLATLLFRIT